MSLPTARISESREDLLSPGARCRYVGGDLRPRYEDEVEAAPQVVSLQGPADGGGQLEGRLSEGNSSEWDVCWGDKSYGLDVDVSMRRTSFVLWPETYPVRRKNPRLLGLRIGLGRYIELLALGQWAILLGVWHAHLGT